MMTQLAVTVRKTRNKPKHVQLESPQPGTSRPATPPTVQLERTKAEKPHAKPTHPPTREMVRDAIVTLEKKKGCSIQAIKKFVAEKYIVDHRIIPYINRYVKFAVTDGTLVQISGIGASGSFKLAPSTTKAAKRGATAKANDPKKASATKSKKAPEEKKATGVEKKSRKSFRLSTVIAKKKLVAKSKSARKSISNAAKGMKAGPKKTNAAESKQKKATDVASKSKRARKSLSNATKDTNASPKNTTAAEEKKKKKKKAKNTKIRFVETNVVVSEDDMYDCD